jgi:glutamate synthase domain-containing protein 3
MTVGTGVIAWGGLCMGTALTLIGGGMYFHSQMVTFETKANMKMEEMSEHIDREFERRKHLHIKETEADLNPDENGTKAE